MAYCTVQQRKVRGLTYLPHGQQFSGWVPKGRYDVQGEVDITYSSLGETMRYRAIKICHQKEGTWYVALGAIIIRDDDGSRRIAAETREHPASHPERPTWLAIVTIETGRRYTAIYAGDRPSDEKVVNDYLSDRHTTRAKNWTEQ